MSEPITEVVAPVGVADVKSDGSSVTNNPSVTTTESLLTRVSQFKEAVKEDKFDPKELDAIPDPAAKEVALKAYKSFEAGYGKKFQDLAEQKKQLEAEKSKYSNWTPQRLQELLNDKDFVASAISLQQAQAPQNSGLTNDQWSALSDNEKAKFAQLEQKQMFLEQQLIRERQLKEDEKLKAKYADYAPDVVDTTVSNLVTGKVQATREDIWKVINHDRNVERAYQLGMQDAKVDRTEKTNASSFEGITTKASSDAPTPEKGENDRNYFRRLTLNRIMQMGKK